jgi:hypothetical protein
MKSVSSSQVSTGGRISAAFVPPRGHPEPNRGARDHRLCRTGWRFLPAPRQARLAQRNVVEIAAEPLPGFGVTDTPGEALDEVRDIALLS